VVLSVIFSSSGSAEFRAILIVARQKLAIDAMQAAGGDMTVLKLRGVTERKRSKKTIKEGRRR
jgi:hypothetical protein